MLLLQNTEVGIGMTLSTKQIKFNLNLYRNPAIGYLVALVKFTNGLPTSDEPFMRYQGPGATGTGWHRPVGIIIK